MNSYQSGILAQIDDKTKDLSQLVLLGVQSGIPKSVMEAHCRAYVSKNIIHDVVKIHGHQPDLFTEL